MRDTVGRAEQQRDLGEAPAADGAIRGHEGGVLGRTPVELGERGAAKLGDSGVDGRLELRELGPERMLGVGVVDVVVGRPEEEVGVEAVELGDGVGEVRVDGREGLAAGGYRREEEREWLFVGVVVGVGVGVLAGEVAEEGGGERDEDGGDGVAAEGRVPLLDLAPEELLDEHLLRVLWLLSGSPSRRTRRRRLLRVAETLAAGQAVYLLFSGWAGNYIGFDTWLVTRPTR